MNMNKQTLISQVSHIWSNFDIQIKIKTKHNKTRKNWSQEEQSERCEHLMVGGLYV